ncbi:FAD-dependent monooxygenase [Jiulongibacter sp. NS-SX5]|uniref:FAD-dependent monooxygenase n=1 Tax=Jiulongibacter sp. NS-SX5 TaxID=3463854 RepID=UPI0040589D37
MNDLKKILIVGGGIGGQTAAIGLAQKGFDVEIVELQQAFDVYGVGIIQQANALRALDAIGVADETLKRGYPYDKIKLHIVNGTQIGEAGTPPIGRFPSHNGISRRVLHEVLFEKCEELGIAFRMGQTVESLENKTDGVDVKFSDGSKGSYDLLIAADGINSRMRSLEFGEYTPEYVGLSVWRYAFKRPTELETGMMFFGKKSKVGLIPMSDDSIYMFLVSAEGEDPRIDQAQLVPKLKEYMSEYPVKMIQDLIEDVTDAGLVNYRTLDTLNLPAPWFKNRVVVLGDAAHATIPQLGSGAALAIEDAVVLTEELSKEQSMETALGNYMERRYERCKMVVEASETLGKWELMEFTGQPLPEEANPGKLMGITCGKLVAPI